MSQTTILKEALHIDYRLRSTFFYRKLHELGYAVLDREVDKLSEISRNFNWDSRELWGVSEAAWKSISDKDIPPVSVFAHPRVLQEQPLLSAYYRNVAALSQKAAKKLAMNKVNRIESGIIDTLNPGEALTLCKLYNAHTSLIIESAPKYTKKDAVRMMLVSAGAQINGSWLNQIGIEAELIVRKMLVRASLNACIVNSVICSDEGTLKEVTEDILDSAGSLTGIRLDNQTSILFSSEPDLSILDSDGSLIAVIEIKGGKDTAGALERYGAAKKSFDAARRQNPQVVTVYLASCITDEVQNRLLDDEEVSNSFNLTEILIDDEVKSTFINFIFRLLKYETEH